MIRAARLIFILSLLGGLVTAHFALSQQSSQSIPDKPQNVPLPRPSGMATGGIHAPIKDSHSRPITAGGFVDDAQVIFVDITHQAGLDKFHHRSGSLEKSTIIEAPGSGVALLDYDDDGWIDIYFLNGSTVAAVKGGEPAPRAMLFHNHHDGTFTDVTDKAGVSNDRWGFGVAVAYYDNDGWPDIYVSNYGDGTFTAVSLKAGVADREGRYGFASVFADVDNDGWPDLIVANDSTPNYLYRNRRDGTFEDISYMSGFALNEEGRAQASMGIALGDYNHSGRLGLFITTFSDDYKTLYRNDGNASFTDVSFKAGLGSPTIPFLGWGTGFLDFDNDGLLDLFIANGHVYPIADQRDWGTTWAQRPQLFRTPDGAKFQEVPPATGSGLAAVVCGRGAAFGDLFNDGHIDVVLNNLDFTPTLIRNVVHNSNHWVTLKLIGQTLTSTSSSSAHSVAQGEPSSTASFSSSSIVAADRGGRLSLPPGMPSHHSSSDAIGAKVFLTAGGVRQRADVFSGASYDSTTDPRLHFGLGSASKVDKLEIFWPSGLREEVTLPCIDCVVQIVEGKGSVTGITR